MAEIYGYTCDICTRFLDADKKYEVYTHNGIVTFDIKKEEGEKITALYVCPICAGEIITAFTENFGPEKVKKFLQEFGFEDAEENTENTKKGSKRKGNKVLDI